MIVIWLDVVLFLDCLIGIYFNFFKTYNIMVFEYMLIVYKFRNENNFFMKLKYFCFVVVGIC